MEENENNGVEPEVSTGTKENTFVSTLKNKKIIIVLVAIVVVVLIVLDLLITSPKEAAKKYLSNIYNGHTKKSYNYWDWAGFEVLSDLDDDEYEDFWEEYKEYKDSDDWSDRQEEIEEYYDDEYYEDADDDIKDSDTKKKIKKVTKCKKVASHLYKVSVKVQTTDEDGDKDTDTLKLYVMKNGLKSYVVGYDY